MATQRFTGSEDSASKLQETSVSPAVASPRWRLSRTFQRGDALFRVAYSDDAVHEQDGDALPREKKLTSPDAILRAVDKAIEKRLAEGFIKPSVGEPATGLGAVLLEGDARAIAEESREPLRAIEPRSCPLPSSYRR